MKRFYSLFILLVGVLSSLMAHDAEVNGIYYNLDATNKTAEVTYKGDTYKAYDEYSGSVNIPESITYNDVNYKVVSIGSSAFVDCGNLTSVTVPNSVTTIRSWAFGTNRGQTATAPVTLQYLTLGSGITTIENNAFYNARGCFEDCIINYKGTADSWAKINFENSSANPVREANKLYINGELLTEVEITSATSIAGGAFYGCADITSVKLGNSVEEIGAAAFSGCTGITSVTLPKSVKTIGANAFENCTGLKTLQIGSRVTSIGAKAFNGCSSLKSVTSYATTVPAVSTNSFSNFIAYLYVPCASKIDYDLDATFGQFKYVECVTEDEGGDDNGNDNTGGDDTGDDNTGDDNTGGDDDGGEVTPPAPTVFDTTTDQGVAFVVNPNSANPVFVPLTYSNYNAEYQTAQYKGTYTVTDLDFTAKIGGLTNLDVINYGTNGQALQPNYLYNPTRGASNGFTITGDYKVGDILNINATFGSDWYVTLIIDVTKTLEPTPNDITLYYVNSNEWDTVNGYVWPTGGVGLLDWPGSPATKTDKTVDGYEIYSYTFDATQADNIIFNNGGYGSQTADLAVVASKPYYYNGVWYETLTFDGEQGGGDTPVVPDPTPEPEPKPEPEPADMYLVGQFSGWAFNADYQFSKVDEDDFVLEFPTGKELQLEGQFKVSSNNWSGEYDFGGNYSVDVDTDYVLTARGSNLSTSKVITVSKVTFNTTTQTIRFSGVSTAKVFDVTKDYGLYLNADYPDNPFTFKGNGVYEASYTFTELAPLYFNVGDLNYSSIELGALNPTEDFTFGTSYLMGETNYRFITPTCKAGTELLFKLTITSDWTATIVVTEKTSDEGGDDTPVDVDYIYIINTPGMGLEKITKYYSNTRETVSAKQPVVISEKAAGYDVYRFEIDADATGIKWFTPDCSSELGCGAFGVSQLERTTPYYANRVWYSSLDAANTWYVQFSGCDYVGCYPIREVQSGIYELKLEKITQSCSYRYVVGHCGKGKEFRAITKSDDPYDYFDLEIPNDGGTYTATLTLNTNNWTQSLSVVKEGGDDEGGDDPVEPETPAYVVRGNGGSDATGIWCGGIEWTNDDSPVNNMTDADKDGIYEVTYKNVPAGTWNFKVVGVTEGWMGSDYLDTENSSAGYTTAPYDGNIGFTLTQAADVTVKFNTATGKIILTTPSGSFGKVKIDYFAVANTDECYVENIFEANNNTLKYTVDIQVNEESGYGYAVFRILGNCNYAVYENNLVVEVTESGKYEVTIVFNGDYENPDFTVTAVKQGGSTDPEDPDNPDTPVAPDPVISDITVPTFSQIEVGETATATLTYTLENATNATATVEAPFYIQSQSVVNGKGTVEILFMPEAKGVHTATLSIKSGNVTETASLVAKAVDPKPEVLPVISNINVPAFADTYINATNVVTATYSLANATEATATISGTNADAFYILSQSVGSVKILFMPEAKGTYNAILTITSGKTTESVNLTAKAIEFIPEPEPAISNVNVPAFATIEIGNAANVTATFSLENATEVSATLSGTGADAFILGQPMVNNGNGSIKIAFVPENAGTYTATLTLKSGKTVHTATITAVATEPAPQVRIENIQVPVFEEVYLGGYTSVNVTYTLVNATKATVTVTGDVFSTGSNVVVGGKGTVPVDFMPETAGVHTATLTITAGGVSESVTLVAIAKLKSTDEPSGKVTISNIQVPEFASITAKETTTVTASYVLTGATSANASLSGTDAAYFTILSQTLSEGVGQVEIKFAPTVAREYNATLVVTSGSVTESIEFSATASEAPSISGLHVNDFGTVYVGEKVTVMANYSLAYAETATATLSGDTDVFAISRQMVSDGNGVVRIDFTPNAVGTYYATLTIKSGVSEESISFSATAIKYEEPEIEPVISNLIVPEFGEVLIGETVQKIATYTLENATEATATLSGDKAFTITRTLNGAVRIMFAPTEAGTYSATLTITSGKVSESISFSATAIKDVEPEIEPVISNLIVPDFGEVLIGETVQRIATYTLENATEATATLSGDDAFTITRTLYGAVRIMFAPTEAGTYSATLTITSGKVSESITFSAKAVEEGGEEPGPGPEVPVEPEKPDPLPEYPVVGYMYVANTPDEELEKMVKYKPLSVDKVDYFLAPEKTELKVYGYDIYKFEVRATDEIDLWEYPDATYTSWHIDVSGYSSATPYLANGVWYSSLEEMMTWYVIYEHDGEDYIKPMTEKSPALFTANYTYFEEESSNSGYTFCLGNTESPIIEIGETWPMTYVLNIPQGFNADIYLDATNWETAWNVYHKLNPPGTPWDKNLYMDLGLSSGLYWAVQNVGATKPEEKGEYFAWGETEPKEDYSHETYKWHLIGTKAEYCKYVTDDYYGLVDLRSTLDYDDDAANANWGGKWHIPTKADFEELFNECTYEYMMYEGVNGYIFTGPNGNTIFIPSTGTKEGTDYEEEYRAGYYWTSSLALENERYAYSFNFFQTSYINLDYDYRRHVGLSIRPVIHEEYVGIDEAEADLIDVYAKEHTIYCDDAFEVYTVTGLNVTHLNGSLEGVYIVKTEKGNRLVSVW